MHLTSPPSAAHQSAAAVIAAAEEAQVSATDAYEVSQNSQGISAAAINDCRLGPLLARRRARRAACRRGVRMSAWRVWVRRVVVECNV